MDDIDRILREYDKLQATGIFDLQREVAEQNARMSDAGMSIQDLLNEQDTVMRDAPRSISDYVDEYEAVRRARNLSMADRLNDQTVRLDLTTLQGVQATYDEYIRNMDKGVLATADDMARNILKANPLIGNAVADIIETQELTDALTRAAEMAISPTARDLLARAEEVLKAPEFVLSDLETATSGSGEAIELPSLEGVFDHLDRDSLLVLVSVLIRLTYILAPTLGVAGAVSDEEFILDSGAYVAYLYMLLVEARNALQKKNGEE